MKRKMTKEERIAFAKAMTFACFFVFLMFFGIYKMLDHDRNKMRAFIAKCEAAGNHAIYYGSDSGVCYKGPQPEVVEVYHYEFK